MSRKTLVNEDGTRTCTRCGADKPATEEFFYPRGDGHSGGLAMPCRDCRATKRQRMREENPTARQQEMLREEREGTRQCKKCGILKPLTEEYFHYRHDHASFRRICKDCKYQDQSERARKRRLEDPEWAAEVAAKQREYARDWYWANVEKERGRKRQYRSNNLERERKRGREAERRAHKAERRYGMTPEMDAAELEKQGGVCKVPGCGSDNAGEPFHHDHDHACCPGENSCGKCFRGLLCGRCNRALGQIHDNPVVAIGLAEYLLDWFLHVRSLERGYEVQTA